MGGYDQSMPEQRISLKTFNLDPGRFWYGLRRCFAIVRNNNPQYPHIVCKGGYPG